MDEVTATGNMLKLWAWVENNKRQATWGAGIVVMLGLVVWFFVWRHSEQEVKAGEALSEVFVPQMLNGGGKGPSVAQGYLKVAATYPGYDAGAQALLLGAGDLFIEGKYEDAKAAFLTFVREHGGSPLESSALLGVAACLDAEHKTNEARTTYKSLIDQHPNDPVVLQAKFSLARLYAAQNQPEMARNYFEEVGRNRGSLLSSEAGLRLEELYQQHPELAPAAAPSMQLTPKSAAAAPTNAPAKAPAKTPAATPAKAPAKSDKK